MVGVSALQDNLIRRVNMGDMLLRSAERFPTIMSREGRLLPAGLSGEIVYRSPQVLTGYLNNEQATAEVFRDGWFHSGDAGHFDGDGVLWFDDRFKDVVKTGRENVPSLEVENAILTAEPGIAEVAVVGLPHERWTEAITAFVLMRAGAVFNEDALQRTLRAHLSAFNCPKSISPGRLIAKNGYRENPARQGMPEVVRKNAQVSNGAKGEVWVKQIEILFNIIYIVEAKQ